MRPMKIASLIPATALALALTLVSTDALAWGAQGHRLVARVAETRLTPAAQAEVDRLLASEPDPTLHAIAPWADELRAKDPGLGKRSSINTDAVQWAEASCRIAIAPGVYPGKRTLAPEYAATYRPVAEQELRLAGERLAVLLNATLGKR